MRVRIVHTLLALLMLVLVSTGHSATAAEVLELEAARAVALSDNPGLAEMQARYEALTEIGPQRSSLPDPVLYLNFRNVTEPLVVMMSIPFGLIGGFWLIYLNGYNMSVAVAVGFIALAGMTAEIGVLVLSLLVLPVLYSVVLQWQENH
jgi:hypothetical protein